jgi:bacterioferritin-associated ferredoxin
MGCPLASEEADGIHSIYGQRDEVRDEQQEEPVGQAWFVRDRVKTGGHPREHWNPQEMSRTQDAGETHALIEDRLTCDSNCGHCQNDLRLDMRDEEKTGGVNAYEPYAP